MALQSECCHGQPGAAVEQDNPPATSPITFNNRLFALIIGINEYQDPKIRNLKGSLKDSENMCRFVTDSLHANPLHIKHLRNAEATREGILSAIQKHLIENEEIHHDDAIVFYYAGHGSEEVVEEGPMTRNKMETICPYDERSGARGIPDRTFESLMRQLAARKGDNITAIFDSCHSGGMGRDSDLENSRSLPPPDSPFPQKLDRDIWNAEIPSSRLVAKIHDPYLPYPTLKSHVLLAACQHDELAYEEYTEAANHHTGAFTSLLLDVLRHPERTLTETTYIGLFHTLEQPWNKLRLQKQTPYVEGDNKTRILFSTTDTGRQFPVSLREDGTFSVGVGTIHGIDTETEFSIASGEDYLEGLKPSKVLPLSCNFQKLDDKSLKDDARAEVTKWNQPHLKVYVHPPGNNPSDPDPNYLAADLAIRALDRGRIELERRQGFLPHYAERFISVTPRDATTRTHTTGAAENTIRNTPGHTSAIITAITHFDFHLLHQSRPTVREKLSLRLERLESTTERGENGEMNIVYGPAKNGPDFFAPEEAASQGRPLDNYKGPRITVSTKITDLDNLFCFTLSIRDYSAPLFPYVFAFDASTYEIACFYHPEPTKVGPLRPNHAVSIGYGTEGGDPFKFQPNEVIFFKVFVTSKYVDMKGLEQGSPFSRDAFLISQEAGRKMKEFVASDDFWESSWVYVTSS